mgnify:CR=1 FL=1
MLSLLDLFSGIGGFSLGMEATKRINTVAFCEKDEYCRKVLKKHWSNTQQYIDIRDIDGTKISADIISGGFPCQPFSVAGKRKGTTDDRYLWEEMLRVITEVKPRWVVGENVQGIINIDNGLVLRQVQTDLEAQGFQVQCFLIPASGIGAWHKRNRVWIMAHSDSNRYSDEIRRSTRKKEELSQEYREINSKSRKFSRTSSIWKTNNSYVSNSKTLRNGGRSSEECRNEQWSFQPKEQKGSKVRSKAERRSSLSSTNPNKERIFSTKTTRNNGKNEKKSSNEYIRRCSSTYRGKILQNYWATEPNVGRVAHGIPNRVDRIKSLGNSIVPQIAFEIGKAILAAEDDKEHSIQGKEY